MLARGADGRRSVYGHVITKFLGWVDLLSYGAPPTRSARVELRYKSITFSNINKNFFSCVQLLSQFFAHPVVQNLMKKKWFGTFGKMKRSSWLEVGWWTWIFLNIWCLFDIILFPLLFTLFYIKHRINRVVHRSKGK